MIKKYNILLIICFIVFFCAGFLYLPINKVSAMEVNYPTLGGINPNNFIDLPSFAKYLFLLGMAVGLCAVFGSLIAAGVMYLLSPINPSLLANARSRVSGAIAGLLILVLLYLIVTTINPQLAIFRLNSLPAIPQQPAPTETQQPGIYFYKINDCSASSSYLFNTSDISDLGALKNSVKSVGVVNNPSGSGSYEGFLYDTISFQGKCKRIYASPACQNQNPPFGSSASVFQDDRKPGGDGVYFYRKDCFNSDPKNPKCSDTKCLISQCNANGGYYEVTNSDIKNANLFYIKNLFSLKFTGNSSSNTCTSDQLCEKEDANRVCTQKSCPSLEGNIKSMIINGNYFVLLAYRGKDYDTSTGIYSYCQSFEGPGTFLKIDWEKISNQPGAHPDLVIIIPYKK